jgi:hypothetical protein
VTIAIFPTKLPPDPLKSLTDCMVRVDSVPGSKYGRLITVKHDHLMLDSVVNKMGHLVLDHIKSIIDTPHV